VEVPSDRESTPLKHLRGVLDTRAIIGARFRRERGGSVFQPGFLTGLIAEMMV